MYSEKTQRKSTNRQQFDRQKQLDPSFPRHCFNSMSEIYDTIQEKCKSFADRIIKINDYLLDEAANEKLTYQMVNGKRVYKKTVPVHLRSVANLSNQLLRAGTSIGANNAEACNAISKADFKSKSFIALKEARESLYWIELLHRNNLVKILVARCKRLNQETVKMA